uniref:Uncharacterized protein n=1 Tax=Caenorhabditis japonica TaxID=281687 RepID=A0A8R1I4W3_CAEJA
MELPAEYDSNSEDEEILAVVSIITRVAVKYQNNRNTATLEKKKCGVKQFKMEKIENFKSYCRWLNSLPDLFGKELFVPQLLINEIVVGLIKDGVPN